MVPGNHKNVHLINKSLEVSAVFQQLINTIINTVWNGLKWVGLIKHYSTWFLINFSVNKFSPFLYSSFKFEKSADY